MVDKFRSTEGIAQCMDAYTVFPSDKENIIVALLNMISAKDSKHAGCALFSKSYILDLVANAIEHDVLTKDDVAKLIG